MHAVFFSIRRADLRCLQLQRKLLGGYGLTPARYLMLLAILGESNRRRQCDLSELLGVCSMTVSRMVGSLVEIGMLERSECFADRRTYDLQVTAAARAILKRIHHDLI